MWAAKKQEETSAHTETIPQKRQRAAAPAGYQTTPSRPKPLYGPAQAARRYPWGQGRTAHTRDRTSNNATPTPGTTPAPTALPPRMQWTCIHRETNTLGPHSASRGPSFYHEMLRTVAVAQESRPQQHRAAGTNWGVPRSSTQPTNGNVSAQATMAPAIGFDPYGGGACNICCPRPGACSQRLPQH
jgi:hypothetical protein